MAKAKNKKKDKQRAKIGGAGKAAKRLKAISSNPMVADIVAAALVGAAAALKDAKTARKLAAHAGEEIESLARQGAERGNAMWQLALDIGRRSLKSLTGDDKAPKAKRASKAKAAPKTKAAPRAKTAPEDQQQLPGRHPRQHPKLRPRSGRPPKATKRAAPKAKARPAKRQPAARR